MEYLIRSIKNSAGEYEFDLFGTPITVLAYADDIAIIARNSAGMHRLLEIEDSVAE